MNVVSLQDYKHKLAEEAERAKDLSWFATLNDEQFYDVLKKICALLSELEDSVKYLKAADKRNLRASAQSKKQVNALHKEFIESKNY